ncbi:MAG: ABC transporter permease [Dehalococcoidales bacterium]|nr:ABC transporter permease [Dehalococcoidales bacterium]
MSEVKKLGVVISYEFLKHIRRKRLYVILLLSVVTELAVLIGFPALMDGFPENVKLMATMLSIGPTMAVIGAIFFAGDAIAGEFENKTGYMLFTNPIRRTTLVIGKYLASCLAVAILVIFGYLMVCVSLLAIYSEIPVETAQSFGLCLLYGATVVAITFFFSAISKGAMGATVITLVLIMVISGVIESVLMFAGQPYWFLISTAGDSITLVYGGMELMLAGFVPLDQMSNFPFEFENPDIGLTTLAMVIYLVAGLVSSLVISNRRQLS